MYDEIVQLREQQSFPSTSTRSRMDAAPSSSHHLTAPPPYVAYITRTSASKISSCSSKCSPVCQYAVVLFLYSALFLAAAIISTAYLNAFLSYYSTLWTAVISLINSVIGIIAGITNNDRFLIAHLLLSVASMAAYVACGVICWRDFIKIGTTEWCAENRFFCDNSMFCLLPAYDHKRIRHVYNFTRSAEFTACASLFKTGSSSPLVLIIGAGIGVMLSIYAVICSFTSVKRWSK